MAKTPVKGNVPTLTETPIGKRDCSPSTIVGRSRFLNPVRSNADCVVLLARIGDFDIIKHADAIIAVKMMCSYYSWEEIWLYKT